jgi:ATP-dependent Lon protease
MKKIKFSKTSSEQILELVNHNIRIEGNFLKVIDTSDNPGLEKYVKESIEKDIETRKKRLEITRQVQTQNKELVEWKEKNEQAQLDLKKALEESNKAKAIAEKAKLHAEEDLDLLVKKNQNELVNKIVSTSLIVILGVGLITSILYFYTIVTGNENQIIESSWANMFSILLTNSFSIIGTIMGVKHMQSSNDAKKKR